MKSFYQKREEWYHCKVSHNLSYPSHLHKEVELIYVLSGSVEITLEHKKYSMREGDTSIAFPNIIHSIQTMDTCELLVIIFDSDFIPAQIQEFKQHKPIIPYLGKDTLHLDIPYCIQRLQELSLETRRTPNCYAIGYLTIILSRMFEAMSFEDASHDDLNLLHQLLTYLDNNYTKSLTLDSLAKELNASKFYLSRLFHNQLNTSFHDYVNEKRIKLAEYLLLESNLSITDICYESGFDSTRTFYRTFRKYYHLSPSEYRKTPKA